MENASLQLREVLERFEREAVWGVCDTGRYRCSYYTWGSGPPLLFIHGLADDAVAFTLPIALLSRYFRCIAYNLPTGWGDGARLRRYRHADLVADALTLLDHVGARQAYVLGFSFGSTIALAALRISPERLPRAVLQGGFARRPLAWAEVLLARLARSWPGQARSLPLRTAILHRSHHASFASQPAELWDFFLNRWGVVPIRTLAQRALWLHQIDLRSLLPEIRQPVLLVCGECDPLVGADCQAELLHGLPNVARIELPDCGHIPQYSHPEMLAEVVARFLLPPPCAERGQGILPNFSCVP
jgi:pimeloyl-ACP methyl ester carboxylesterase